MEKFFVQVFIMGASYGAKLNEPSGSDFSGFLLKKGLNPTGDLNK